MNTVSPWSSTQTGTPAGQVSLVDGTTFVVSSPSGAVGDEPAQGLFVLDTRIVSRWVVEVLDWSIAPLTFATVAPFAGTFVSRVERRDEPGAALTLVQRRYLGGGMREDVEVRNHGPERDLVVRLHVGVDLAGLFEVKAGHVVSGVRAPVVTVRPDGIDFVADDASLPVRRVGVTSTVAPAVIDPGAAVCSWTVHLPRGGSWSTCLEVGVVDAAGGPVETTHPCGSPVEESVPVGRMRRWRDRIARVSSDDPVFDAVVDRSLDDLGSLRIFDPDHLDRVVVAAGSPWFMALFGRDSIITSWMALPFDQELAFGVLAELADTQGAVSVELTDEQPGRILHEVRFDPLSTQLLGGSNRYYGSIDSTPLFVMLVAELARWNGFDERIEALLPAVDRAVGWIDRFGDRDGDGFVEYVRGHERGLEHQGWKDSWDGIRHGDGSVVQPPVALCEVQGYVYAALRGRASLARAAGDLGLAAECDRRADDLARRFDEVFWLDQLGRYAIALDADKRPVDSLASNVGHLLWTGIVPPERARRVASSLGSPELFTGFGVRTLACDHPGFDPLSYHCGSVWPHDTAIAVAGLARCGFDAEAQRLATGLLAAARTGGGRLPELFGGFDRADIGAPVPYPTSCSPQAWAAASPLLLLRAFLGLEPDVPSGRIALRPRLPAPLGRIRMRSVPIGGRPVDIDVVGRSVTVIGTDPALTIVST